MAYNLYAVISNVNIASIYLQLPFLQPTSQPSHRCYRIVFLPSIYQFILFQLPTSLFFYKIFKSIFFVYISYSLFYSFQVVALPLPTNSIYPFHSLPHLLALSIDSLLATVDPLSLLFYSPYSK